MHHSFLSQGLVDRMQLYYGAMVLGEGSKKWPAGPLAATITEARALKLKGVRQLGNDVCMEYVLP